MKEHMKFNGLFRYDLASMVSISRELFCICLIGGFAIIISYFIKVFQCLPGQITVSDIAFGDLITYFFSGSKKYIPDSGVIFDIPYVWMFVHLMNVLMTGGSCQKMLEQSYTELLASKSRRKWWISKVFSVCFGVAIVYAVIFLCVCFTIVIGVKGSFSSSPTLDMVFFEDAMDISSGEWWAIFFCLPFLTSLCLAVTQAVIALYFNGIVSDVVILGLMVTAIFYSSPYLIGNGLLPLHSNLLPYAGSSPIPVVLLTDTFLVVVSFSIGLYKVHKTDII